MTTNKKPTGRKSAYICFTQSFREDYQKQNPETKPVFTEISKLASEKWKTLSDSEKKQFIDLAAIDKQRFAEEMKNYEPPEKEIVKMKKTKRAKKEAKDPNKPKKPMTAFFFFSNEFRQSVKQSNPEFKVGDIAKALGEMWSKCEDKSKYIKMNEDAKVEYEKAMEKYNQYDGITDKNMEKCSEEDVPKEIAE